MKMLGQDLLTQDEFDQFKTKELQPMLDQIKTLKKWVVGLSLSVVISISLDIFLLIK